MSYFSVCEWATEIIILSMVDLSPQTSADGPPSSTAQSAILSSVWEL